MGTRLRRIIPCSLLAALAIAAPALSEASVDHARIMVRYRAGASQSTILPNDESRLLIMVNRVRQTHGRLSPLIMDPALRSTARRHSQDMALQGYIGHGSLDGRSIQDRLGWTLRPGTRVGENVAAVQTVEQGHSGFVRSSGHLRNILDPAFRRVGIGVATAGDAGIRITEDFAE